MGVWICKIGRYHNRHLRSHAMCAVTCPHVALTLHMGFQHDLAPPALRMWSKDMYDDEIGEVGI